MILAILLACSDKGGDSSGDSPAPATGTASLSFGATAGVRESSNLVDPLVGDLYGSVFVASEVSVTGPIDGATEWASVEVLGLDLTAGDSAPLFTTPPLAAETYVFLGFFDLDGNGATTFEPDAGDPATLGNTNDFVIVAGEETAFTANFELVLN